MCASARSGCYRNSEAHDWMTFGCSQFGWFWNSGLGGVSGTSSGTHTGILEFVWRVLGALPSTVLRVALISVRRWT